MIGSPRDLPDHDEDWPPAEERIAAIARNRDEISSSARVDLDLLVKASVEVYDPRGEELMGSEQDPLIGGLCAESAMLARKVADRVLFPWWARRYFCALTTAAAVLALAGIYIRRMSSAGAFQGALRTNLGSAFALGVLFTVGSMLLLSRATVPLARSPLSAGLVGLVCGTLSLAVTPSLFVTTVSSHPPAVLAYVPEPVVPTQLVAPGPLSSAPAASSAAAGPVGLVTARMELAMRLSRSAGDNPQLSNPGHVRGGESVDRLISRVPFNAGSLVADKPHQHANPYPTDDGFEDRKSASSDMKASSVESTNETGGSAVIRLVPPRLEYVPALNWRVCHAAVVVASNNGPTAKAPIAVSVTVNPLGMVIAASVADSPVIEPCLGQAAVEAALRSHYEPATRNGTPTLATTSLIFRFPHDE